MSHDSSLSRSLLRSISTLLIVAYSAGAGVLPKSSHMQRKSSLSTIVMQVDVILEFAWIWW